MPVTMFDLLGKIVDTSQLANRHNRFLSLAMRAKVKATTSTCTFAALSIQ